MDEDNKSSQCPHCEEMERTLRELILNVDNLAESAARILRRARDRPDVIEADRDLSEDT